jgi:hypothetical protein
MAGWLAAAFCALIVLKPTALWPGLEGVPIVHLAFALVVLACVVDVVRQRIHPAIAPATKLVAALFAWGLLITAAKAGFQLGAEVASLSILGAVYLAIAIGASSPSGLRAFAWGYVGCAVTVTVIAILQIAAPPRCFEVTAANEWAPVFDGRACESPLDCEAAATVRGDYRCEHPGPWATTSIGFRARFRGSLADPNELAVMTVTAVPLVLALAEGARRRRREARRAPRAFAGVLALPLLFSDRIVTRVMSLLRAVPAVVMMAAVGWVVVLTHSRTGVIVYLVVAGVEMVRRMGAWGLVGGCVVGPPLLLFGGRSGSEASESSDERMQLLVEAIEMIKRTRGLGIGLGRFTDESELGLTAHNAYVLAAAEAGLVGMILFALLFYASVKASASVWFGEHDVHPEVRRMAPALTTSLLGAAVGAFFLSWTFKDILYVLFGASSALYAAARADAPGLSSGLRAREVAAVIGAMLVLLVALDVMGRLRH